ncbi:MAG: hypothetical protein M1829_000357 [Trizodia sp. TS-e1964]|nr:MAG: hypothetical protein M1829_000357 [Trizodia sp. TS-e1964]
MVARKRKPTTKSAEAPRASQNKRVPKPASVQKAAFGRAIDEEEEADEVPEEPTLRPYSLPPQSITPEPEAEPQPLIVIIDTKYQEDQERAVAQRAACLGFSHHIVSFIALISHSKARNKTTLVDLKQTGERWDEVKRFVAYFHKDKKPDIQIELKMIFERKKVSAGKQVASVELSSDPPAIEKPSQKLTPAVQAGLEAAAAIRQPGSENVEFLELLAKLQNRWEFKNRQCSNRDGYCIRFRGNGHSPLSLDEQREWVQAIQAGQATLDSAPINLAASGSPWVLLPEWERKRQWEQNQEEEERWAQERLLEQEQRNLARQSSYQRLAPEPYYSRANSFHLLSQASERQNRYDSCEDELPPCRQSLHRRAERAPNYRRSINEFERSLLPRGRRYLASPLARNPSFKVCSRLAEFDEFEESNQLDLQSYFRWQIRASPQEKPLFLQALEVLEAEYYNFHSIGRLQYQDWVNLNVPTGLGTRLTQEVEVFKTEFCSKSGFYRGNPLESEQRRELSHKQRSLKDGKLPNNLLLDLAKDDTNEITQEISLPKVTGDTQIEFTQLDSEHPNTCFQPYPSKQPDIDILTSDFEQLSPRRQRYRRAHSSTASE